MTELFAAVLNMNITASYVILAVIILRFLLKKAPKVISYALWTVVLFRLLCPFSFESTFSMIPDNQLLIKQDIEGILKGDGIPLKNNAAGQEAGIESTGMDGAVSLISPRQIRAAEHSKAISNVLSLLSLIWVTGMITLFLYNGYSYFKIKGKVKDANKLHSNIYVTKQLKTPFVLGFLKPSIYLPQALTERELKYIVMHEQMHIDRRDYLVKLAAYFTVCIHWFNPLVWIFFILMSEDMEMSCDEAVLRRMGTVIKKEYSASLLNFAVGKPIVGNTPLAFGDRNVVKRIKNVLNYQKPAFCILVAAILCAVVLSVGLLANPVQSSKGQDISILQDNRECVERWARAFIAKDGNEIQTMASVEAAAMLEEQGLLNSGDNYAGFGLSSPWPVDENIGTGYRIETLNESMAEILYYAWTSDPHITVWRETIQYKIEDNDFKVISESLTYYEAIAGAEEFHKAYPDGQIKGTGMDYLTNGLGEALNENATSLFKDSDIEEFRYEAIQGTEDGSYNYIPVPTAGIYSALFEPTAAALYLLNISVPLESGKILADIVQKDKDRTWVEIRFHEEGSSVKVAMVQPFGTEGIWIPQDIKN